ncbi:MAG: hypothetical protein H0T11_08795 [Chthoniobacterales bacterium]|nr:hypothetical protein [Chthoniobacterales bacterium]
MPRPLNAAARQRSWAEAGVRLWWMSAIAIALIVAYLTAARVLSSIRDRSLQRSGIPVIATIERIAGRHQQSRGTPVPVKLSYTLPDGRQFIDATEHLLDATNNEVILRAKDPLPIRVDPMDPTRWTEDRDRGSIFRSLGVSIALLPIVLLLLLLAMLRRRSVLAVWRSGEPSEAVVLSQKSSALAPASQLVSISLVNDLERRVVSVLHPRKAGVLSKGDTLWVVAPQGKPHRAIEAKLYMEQSTKSE